MTIAAQHLSMPLPRVRTPTPGATPRSPFRTVSPRKASRLVVTLTGAYPPGGIEVTGGTVRIRFAGSDPANGTVTMELSDPPPPPANKPLVVIERGPGGAPHVTVAGGKALVRLAGWDGITEPAPGN